MNPNLRYPGQCLLIGLASLMALNPVRAEWPVIKGVYGNPAPLWEKEPSLGKLGINAIFVRGKSIDRDMMKRARSGGLMVFAEFATLNGRNYVEEHPEAWAVNERGEKVQPASWFMGVCPTDPGFRKYRMDELRDLLAEHDVDGIWMDYVHWHAQFEEPQPILPETCFCQHCVDTFAGYAGITPPDGTIARKAGWILDNHDEAWRDWRCGVIYDWAREMKTIVREIRPDALLGLYHCPWNDDEFDGARRRILGLDLDLLKQTVDVFSPMVYHERMGRHPGWVRDYVNWLCDRLGTAKDSQPMVWPIVQALDKPGVVSPGDFETVLRHGLSGKSSGVMMFTASAIAGDDVKKSVMQDVYTSLK